MKAIIWGSCGSIPSPITPASIRQKLIAALWNARNIQFASAAEVEAYLDSLPLSARGTYKANTSCVQILTRSRERFLCDAGTGIREYGLSLDPCAEPASYHIFISHLHWDHIQGFPFFAPAFKAGNRITFHGFHPEIEATIRKQMEPPCFPVPFDAMQAEIRFDIRKEGEEFDIDGVRVQAIKQKHPGDSWGYSFEHEGQRIIYSSDSEHGPEAREADYSFIDFIRAADVLIIDGQYTLEEAINEKRDWGHSNHITAVQLAAQAEVKKLVVFHHEPSYPDTMLEMIHQNALEYIETYNQTAYPMRTRSFPLHLLLAYDGLCIEA